MHLCLWSEALVTHCVLVVQWLLLSSSPTSKSGDAGGASADCVTLCLGGAGQIVCSTLSVTQHSPDPSCGDGVHVPVPTLPEQAPLTVLGIWKPATTHCLRDGQVPVLDSLPLGLDPVHICIPSQLFIFAFVVGVPGRVAVSAMAIGEPGVASKPASPATGPTQVRCFAVKDVHLLADCKLVV
jgi:hypothetical protein